MCHCLSLPGFGGTPEPPRPYTVGDYADEVLATMEREGVENAVFVGHSFGGRVALEIAAKHPEKAVALALVDSAGLKPRRGVAYHARVAAHKLLRALGFGGLRGSSDYRVLSPVMKATFVKVVNYDQSPLLRDIRCPTAIFWGREDSDTPMYMAERFERGVADAHLFKLDGGHFAYLTDPSFFPVLHAFLRGVFPS